MAPPCETLSPNTVTGRSRSVKRTAEGAGFHYCRADGLSKEPRLAQSKSPLGKGFRGVDRQRQGLGLAVYHGLHGKHLQSYLDEFVFRFNSRRSRHRAFRSRLGIATGHQHVPYKILISPEKRAQGFRCIQSP